jgi:hypothetical protein
MYGKIEAVGLTNFSHQKEEKIWREWQRGCIFAVRLKKAG